MLQSWRMSNNPWCQNITVVRLGGLMFMLHVVAFTEFRFGYLRYVEPFIDFGCSGTVK